MKKIQKKQIEALKEIIKNYDNFILFTHINPDGDAIGSVFGFYYFLETLEKDVIVFTPNPIPYYYEFLIKDKIKTTNNLDKKYEIGIVFDCSDVSRVIENYDLKKNVNLIINIDHHPTNTFFGDINIVNPEASSVTEIIYYIIKKFTPEIPKKVADCLITGLITDTGSFKYSNTTYKTLKIAGDLVKSGVQVWEISREIYDKRRLSSLRLLGIALLRLQLYGKIGWSYIEKKDMDDYNANIEDTEGIIDLLRTLRDVDLVILFYPISNGRIKVSMRSKNRNIDVSKIALKFGGGGHKEAAGFQIESDNSFSYLDILQKISEYVNANGRIYSNK